MNTPPSKTSSPSPSSSRLAIILGSATALLCLAAAWWWLAVDRLPAVNSQTLRQARETWQTNRPPRYRMTVQVGGRQPATYVATVDQNVTESVTLDGRPINNQRTLSWWSVLGLFAAIERDLAENEREPVLLLRGRFDNQWGIPRKYQRMEMRSGAHDAISWEITHFEPLDPARPVSETAASSGESQ